MQIDLEILKTNGQQHIDQLIETAKEEAWASLVAAKFSDNPPNEIEKVLWSHGFMRGAEAATKLTAELYTLINQAKS